MASEKQGFPDVRDNELRRQAEEVYHSAEDLVDWASGHAASRKGSDFPIKSEQEFELLQLRRRAARLLSSSRIPVAAAVYGASQVGKSLFVGRILEPHMFEIVPSARATRSAHRLMFGNYLFVMTSILRAVATKPQCW